jgi:hypothetical protein
VQAHRRTGASARHTRRPWLPTSSSCDPFGREVRRGCGRRRRHRASRSDAGLASWSRAAATSSALVWA